MLRKLTQIAVLCLLPLSSVMAKGIMITCPLTMKSDDHLYRDFVQNCGARVEDIGPKIFEIIFASIADVDPKDSAVMTQVVQKWIQDHKAAFQGLSLDLSDVKLQNDEMFVTTTFLTNQLYSLRDELQSQIHCAAFLSGRTYDLDASSRGYHLFSVMVAETTGIKHRRAVRALHTLQDRVEQAKIIYHDDYTQVQLEQPVLR